jgi:allantoinase
VAPNIEFYELDPPKNPGRAPGRAPHPDVSATRSRLRQPRRLLAHAEPARQVRHARLGLAVHVALCEHHPEIIEECAKRNWEFFSHGIYNTRYTYGMTEAQEREVIQDSIETIRKHTGQKLDGYLAPALTYTERTLDLFAEAWA